ncbi:hypothetical protein C8J56DRAFT_1041978 [Mycena floridula]|nr:hypothetical protein C8J56DRAFT_1041978 [Mycena floridula]
MAAPNPQDTLIDLGDANFLSIVQWFRKGRSNTLVEKAVATNPTVLSVPDAKLCATGRVHRESMFCGMTGNVVSLERKVRPMDKAKYTFQIEASGTDIQQTAFNDGYQNLDVVQGRCAKSDIHDDHLVDGRLRFVKNVFSPLAGAPVDAAMQTWTGPERVQHAVDALKGTHRVHPLLVYDVDGTLIRPIHIRDAMEGRLVEVIYNLKHWYIESAKKDSFSADIVSVRILREEPPSLEDDASSTTLSEENGASADINAAREVAAPVMHQAEGGPEFESSNTAAVSEITEPSKRKRRDNGVNGSSKKAKADA